MFGKNSFNDNVLTSLTHMIRDGITSRGSGAAKFTRSDKKTVGYIYFQDGQVYAASMSNYMPNFLTRLVQSGFIDDKQLTKITRYFGEENLSDPKIPDFVADNFMVETNILTNVKQDFFIEIFETILGWTNVNAEWRVNEITNVYKINPVDPVRVLNLVENRNKFLDKVADDFGVDVVQIKKLIFTTKKPTDFDEQTPLIFNQVMSSANGEWTISDTAQRFGLTLFVTIQAVYELWKADFITVIYDNEYPIDPYIPEKVETTPLPEPERIPEPVVTTATNVVTVTETVSDDEEEETVELSEPVSETTIEVPAVDEVETVAEVENVEPIVIEESEAEIPIYVETYENDFKETVEKTETVETQNEEVEIFTQEEPIENVEETKIVEDIVTVASPIDTLIAQLAKEVTARKERIEELNTKAKEILDKQESIAEQVKLLQTEYQQLNNESSEIQNEIEKLSNEIKDISNKTKNIS